MNSQDNHQISSSEDEIIDILKNALLNSFQKLKGIQKCGILFSGGVDSSLAALLAKRYCDEVTLFSSCTEDSRDFRFVSRAADILNLTLMKTKMSSESVWQIA
jgi:asparagine synthase (glutamine-hydrolysing)